MFTFYIQFKSNRIFQQDNVIPFCPPGVGSGWAEGGDSGFHLLKTNHQQDADLLVALPRSYCADKKYTTVMRSQQRMWGMQVP